LAVLSLLVISVMPWDSNRASATTSRRRVGEPEAATVAICTDRLGQVGSDRRFGRVNYEGVSVGIPKMVEDGYLALGIYRRCNDGCVVRLVTRTDSVHWSYRTTLDPSASQPHVGSDPPGRFV
jgi:hypothetical protein